jgi:hypothetical protein
MNGIADDQSLANVTGMPPYELSPGCVDQVIDLYTVKRPSISGVLIKLLIHCYFEEPARLKFSFVAPLRVAESASINAIMSVLVRMSLT